jgi:RNA 2',3'-cyclic 3'-phosphodiesterase
VAEPARWRLFVAGDLPPAARGACAGWRDAAVDREPGLRPVADAALHVTLSFLGYRSAEAVQALAPGLERCVRPVEGLALGAPRWLPARRPRVLALELDDSAGGLGGLRAGVAAVTDDRERRPFLPHVTVARVRAGTRVRPRHPPPAPDVGRFALAALTLYRSHLGRAGARYEALWRADLAALGEEPERG